MGRYLTSEMTHQTTTFHLQEDVSGRLANYPHTKACARSSDIIYHNIFQYSLNDGKANPAADIKGCHPNAELQ